MFLHVCDNEYNYLLACLPIFSTELLFSSVKKRNLRMIKKAKSKERDKERKRESNAERCDNWWQKYLF